jgi:hypothetical protein
VTLTYSTDGLSAATATGTAGSNTITTSANVSANLAVGARIRLGAAGTVTTADTMGADTYTITAISGTTITLSSNLTQNYTTSTLYRGLVSQLADKSGEGNNATQATAANMPLWISNGQNGLGTASFDGVAGGDIMLISTFNLSGTTSTFISALRRQQTNPSSCCRPLISASASTNGQYIGVFNNNTSPTDAAIGGWWNIGSGSNSGAGSWAVNTAAIVFAYLSDIGSDNFEIGTNGASISTTSATGNSSVSTFLGGENTNTSRRFNGNISETIVYYTAMPTAERNLMHQYQSAKWGIALTPPGTGATEVAKATAADGYSAFTTRYLERLSQSADISLQATNSITLDLKGDTLALASDRNLSLTTTNGNIASVSAGTITTTRTGSGGNITLNAGGSGTINVSNMTLNANNGGSITMTSGGEMTLGTMNAGSILARTTGATSDLTIASGKTLTASASGNAITLASGRNFINNAGSGALSAPSGRFLVYSDDPANDAAGGLTAAFRRYSCTYAGSCSNFSSSGNGFLYSSMAPIDPTPAIDPNNASRIMFIRPNYEAVLSVGSESFQQANSSNTSAQNGNESEYSQLPPAAGGKWNRGNGRRPPFIAVDPELQALLGLPPTL